MVVLGPSGCGKTTLLSCLGGILSPTSGQIRFGATEVTALSRREITSYRRRTVGIVFQAFNLVASLTALENVMVPMWAAAGHSGRPPNAPGTCSPASAWPTGPTTGPASSAAVSSNASRWRAPWHWTRH